MMERMSTVLTLLILTAYLFNIVSVVIKLDS